MGKVTDSNLSFDGSVSTADQFSTPHDFTLVSLPTAAAFLFDVDLGTGPFAITLQVNADPVGDTVFGWEDVASPGLQILNMVDSTYLIQTDTGIESSKLRGGVFTGSSTTGTFLLQFEPIAASHRLRFQITAATDASINNIILTVP
jgi:hypothetical protein